VPALAVYGRLAFGILGYRPSCASSHTYFMRAAGWSTRQAKPGQAVRPDWPGLRLLSNSSGSGSPTLVAAFLRGSLIHLLAPARTALLATAGHFVHRSPGTPLRLFFRYTVLLVSFLDVLGLAFLFCSIFGLVSSWHTLHPFSVCVPCEIPMHVFNPIRQVSYPREQFFEFMFLPSKVAVKYQPKKRRNCPPYNS
jgi:hypothetical protein